MLIKVSDNNYIPFCCVFLDIMKSKSNPDFLKKEQSKLSRGVRSKVNGHSLFFLSNDRHLVSNSKIHVEFQFVV